MAVTLIARSQPRPHRFMEVDPKRTSLGFARYLSGALEVLRASPNEVARGTFRLIASGRVKVDELSDMTQADFRRLRHGMRNELKLGENDLARLRQHGSRVHRLVSGAVNGFQWDERVYVARGMSPAVLADTLVHEVSHVLNRSEENYRGQRAILVEEYRAFYAERLARGEKMTPEKAKALKQHVIRLYGLDRVTAADVSDVPPGQLVPRGPQA